MSKEVIAINDVYVIDNLNQLRVLADPLRVVILQKLRDTPMTASQLAQLLGESPNKIHYHVTELERIGAIKIAETRQKGNLIEKYYALTAKIFSVNRDIFHLVPNGVEAYYQGIIAVLDATILDLHKALEANQAIPSMGENCLFIYNKVRLNADQIGGFRKKVQELCTEFEAAKNPEASVEAGLTLIFYTTSPEI